MCSAENKPETEMRMSHIWHISWYLWELKALLFDPSKNGSPLGQKMDEPSAYVPGS
jgi:hypothetical protein